MIIIVTTHSCRGAHKELTRWKGVPAFECWSYWKLFHRRNVPHATYIFTDFDRLGPWELELAANLFRTLKAAGQRVLNDPAKFLPRHALLKRLQQEGLNSFHSWNPAQGDMPDRFPVFLRTQAGHRGPISDLVESESGVKACLEQALRDGYALSDLLFIEYAAEPLPGGPFCKFSAYRIDDQIVPGLSVYTKGWVARSFEKESASQLLHEQDLERMKSYPFGDDIMQVFQTAEIDYGRIDFGLRNDRLETYEINTNPWMGFVTPDGDGPRSLVKEVVQKGYISAFQKIDSPSGKRPVHLDSPILKQQRARDRRWLWTRRWTP